MPGPEREIARVLDLHVILPGAAPQLIVQVVDGRPVIMPPASTPPIKPSPAA